MPQYTIYMGPEQAQALHALGLRPTLVPDQPGVSIEVDAMPRDEQRNLRAALNDNRKIAAIKVHYRYFNCGLKESKEAVERFMEATPPRY